MAVPLGTGTARAADPARLRAVGLTVALSALDGYDVLSITFAAPAISRAWGIGKVELGVVLSSGLAGMALGSFLIAPLADRIGRRRTLLLSLMLMGAGSLLSATADGTGALVAWRLLTGLGIGACVAVIVPLSAEMAEPRWRPVAVAAMAMGYPVGGLVGGLLAAALLRWSGWPAIFVAGGVAAAAMVAATLALLPSPSPRREKGRGEGQWQGASSLDCPSPAIAPLGTLSPMGRGDDVARGYAGVFAAAQRGTTARLALVNAMAAAVVYYVLSWLPQLVGDAGLSPAQASLVSATLSLVGIVGGLTVGALARRYDPVRVTALGAAGLGVALMFFGAVPATMAALTLAAGALGFLVFGTTAGFYAVLAAAFDDACRASGSGFVIGVGRVSSAAGPAFAGWLFAIGLGRGAVSAAFAGGALLAAVVLARHSGRGTGL